MKNQPMQFLIDGIDRLGKSSLANNIMDRVGYRLMIHYDKPKLLSKYANRSSDPLRLYQEMCNETMFDLIDSGMGIITDRTHLGELVYAPMYRGYDGDYVLRLERNVYTDDCRLILLITTNFDMLEDDGESFDFSKKEEEQAKFLEAFRESSIKDKIIIDVHDGNGGYKDYNQILVEALKL